MIKLLIVADDFTGALDTGVQLSSRGIPTKIITRGPKDFCGGWDCLADVEEKIEVLVYDSETRHLSSQDAGKYVGKITYMAYRHGVPYLYKKTDSALRGNIGAELSAFLRFSARGKMAFLPAFPKMNRETRDGVHLIGGVEVARSVFGADPFNPVKHSRVEEIIREQSETVVHHVKRDMILGQDDSCSKSAFYERMKEGITVFDASDQEDLHRAAARMRESEEGMKELVFAGCAGFAAELPFLLGFEESPVQLPKFENKFTVLCGSINPITRRQMKRAEEEGFTRILLVQDPGFRNLICEDSRPKGDPFAEYRRAIQENPYVILDSNEPQDVSKGENSLTESLRLSGYSIEEARSGISQALGRLMKEIYDTCEPGLVMITGGDTLFECMKQMQVQELLPIGELFPGVVLAAFTYQGRKRYVLTKSGGFGEETLLCDITEQLNHENES